MFLFSLIIYNPNSEDALRYSDCFDFHIIFWTSCLPCVVCFVDFKSMKKVGIYEKHNDLRSTM